MDSALPKSSAPPMPRSAEYQRIVWSDRFNCPTVASLRAGLKPPARAIFDKLRKHLADYDRVSERIAWFGESWRWVVEFRVGREAEPFAVIVPSPEELQLAVPTTQKFAQELTTRRLKRAVRDGLDLASAPFDTRWAVWPVTSASMLADLTIVLDCKRSYLIRSAS